MKIELVGAKWYDRLSDIDKTKVQVMDAFLKNVYTTEEEAEELGSVQRDKRLMTTEDIREKLFPAIFMTNEFIATVMRMMGYEMRYDRIRETVVWVMWFAAW